MFKDKTKKIKTDKYVILTGGTGFVGSHLLDELIYTNQKVILIKRSFSDTWRINHLLDSPNLTVFNSDKENISEIFQTYDVEGIYHLATFSKKKHETKDIPIMIDSNIKFSTYLLDCAVNSGVQYFINTGTFSEYSQKKLPITEESIYKSFNLYAATKLAFERILEYYSKDFDLNIATLKLFTPFGSRDDEIKLIPYLILSMLKDEHPHLKNPTQNMDLIFIKDVVDAFIKASNNYSKFHQYTKFNIATGKTYQVFEIYNIINSLVKGFDCNLEDKNRFIYTNPKKANDILGWKSNTSLKEGLDLTIDYYRRKYNL